VVSSWAIIYRGRLLERVWGRGEKKKKKKSGMLPRGRCILSCLFKGGKEATTSPINKRREKGVLLTFLEGKDGLIDHFYSSQKRGQESLCGQETLEGGGRIPKLTAAPPREKDGVSAWSWDSRRGERE